MNSLLILLISIGVLIIGYVVYGSWLAKQWGVDARRVTPAHTQSDGMDYMPAKASVLLGHHFASIAGAGPINGPIQAAVFGWVPVLLWILIGGIFFGAVQDFSSLLASIRHKGRSVGVIIEKNIGLKAKRLFLCFAYLTLILVVAAFASIVVGTFDGVADDGSRVAANGSTATISLLFILMAIIFGFAVYRRKAPLALSTVIGVAGIVICIILGLKFPLYLDSTAWLIIVCVYIAIASVTPVWILLQPRDYLSSFLLYAMMLAAFAGVIGTHPAMELPAFTGFRGLSGDNALFPLLFITVACGAISGFHSLVGSGTTAKQLDNERDAKVIGYGGMLIECALAVVALICVGVLFQDGAMPAGTPTQVFAAGIATMIQGIAGEATYDVAYALIILSVSAFCLTSLDTATRLARYMFQEFFLIGGQKKEELRGIKKLCVNPYFATGITVLIGGWLAVGGYARIWPLFGSANQLLAALALLAAAAWLGNSGKNNKMFYVPMAFMLIATLSALILTLHKNIQTISAGGFSFGTQGFQILLIVLLIVLALDLTIEGFKTLRRTDPPAPLPKD
ncbi:MAG: carbon starvation protein A [Bacillota bacterium]|nr:carbon starvation protein A [Bacillota bacterium]